MDVFDLRMDWKDGRLEVMIEFAHRFISSTMVFDEVRKWHIPEAVGINQNHCET